MSEPLRTDISTEHPSASAADRETKIEQLLLAGLEHYFAARYDQAINVWTRALFLDRGHARARAYIERARTAQAERQRESEELLQQGVSAFTRGDAAEARRLLEAALAQGAPSDEALAVLDRLTRLEQGTTSADTGPVVVAPQRPAVRDIVAARIGWAAIGALTLVIIGAAAFGAGAFRTEWRSALRRAPAVPTAHLNEAEPPLPRRGELALARARALVVSGRLRDGLAALDDIWPTDPEKPEADRLRAEIQQQLIAVSNPAAASSGAGLLP
jgi:tetratricopeptide (TPR) repeat protein